ncbi:phospholipase A [Desulfobacter latus]|uniref:Phosphatidylcholine 1-acylhydrolase n=1 Tax=Desulfobacter latus TaxID=2292 RepID=A0A850SQM9_9BACT|nr:phospholipase A [Desulfobacter latus]NWH03754.1 phospholipase A [Desulfobacter latus]
MKKPLRNRYMSYALKTTRLMVVFFVVLALDAVALHLTSARACTSTTFLVPPRENAVAGQPTRFTLFVQNAGTTDVITTDYDSVMVTLRVNEQTHVVRAICMETAPGGTVTLPAGGFAKLTYAFELPQDMTGTISLTLDDFKSSPVLFAAVPPVEPQNREVESASQGQLVIGVKQNEFQPFLKNLSAYEPVYFLFGVDPGLKKSKFQVSFKYKLFNAPFDSRGLNSLVDGLHLAYTQTAYWDLKSTSKPFTDSSYKPELFYLVPKIDLALPWVKMFGVQGGFQHESNGKSGDDSRSTNYIYIKPIMEISLFDQAYLTVAPKLWTYVINEDESNPDLADYRGYFDLQIQAGKPMGLCLNTHTRWAEAGPSIQADLSYPLTSFFNNGLNLYLHFQYFNGYAERLKAYSLKEEIFRVGFSLSR